MDAADKLSTSDSATKKQEIHQKWHKQSCILNAATHYLIKTHDLNRKTKENGTKNTVNIL